MTKRPDTTGLDDLGLNARQRDFLALLALGKSMASAARATGVTNARRDGMGLIMQRVVQQRSKRIVQAKLITMGAPAAYEYLVKTMLDVKTPMQYRISIAKDLLAAGGHVAPNKNVATSESDGREIGDMTKDELQTFIRSVEKEIGDRAQPITIEQVPADAIPATQTPRHVQSIDDLI